MSAKKDEEARVNRNPQVHNLGALEWDGETRGPRLEDEDPERTWSARTLKWWNTWRKSPQAMLMTDTDWEEMLICAVLHNLIWGTHMMVDKTNGGFIDVDCDPKDAKALAGEIRIRLEKMGATIKDRGSMGMRIRTSGADVVREAERTTEEATRSGVDYRKQLREPERGEQ